ncbi:MAG: hypothetical protein ACXVKK_04090 [Flavisolibacter sp.]
MTEYGDYTRLKNLTPLPDQDVQARKEARKKLLQEIEERRRTNSRNYYNKLRLQIL